MGSHNIEIIRYRMFQHNSLEMLALLLPKETIAKERPTDHQSPLVRAGGTSTAPSLPTPAVDKKTALRRWRASLSLSTGMCMVIRRKNYIAFKVNQAFASIRLRNSLDVILLDLHHLNPGR